jgi:hypothetical protein
MTVTGWFCLDWITNEIRQQTHAIYRYIGTKYGVSNPKNGKQAHEIDGGTAIKTEEHTEGPKKGLFPSTRSSCILALVLVTAIRQLQTLLISSKDVNN